MYENLEYAGKISSVPLNKIRLPLYRFSWNLQLLDESVWQLFYEKMSSNSIKKYVKYKYKFI